MAAGTALALGGAVAGLGSSIFGGIKARKARKKAEKEQRRILNRMNEDNESMFLKDYYQSALDDPTAKSYLKRISGDLYDRNKGAENNAISTGATHENLLAQKQSANEVMSDAVNNVVVNQEQKKAVAKDRYLSRKDAIASGNMETARSSGEMQAQNWSTLGSNVADSINGLSSAYLQSGKSPFGKKVKAGTGGGSGLYGTGQFQLPEPRMQDYKSYLKGGFNKP